MSDQTQEQREDDFADVCAAVAILVLVVGTVVYWLQGMPTQNHVDVIKKAALAAFFMTEY